jgi:preprotein translocase subunit SecA
LRSENDLALATRAQSLRDAVQLGTEPISDTVIIPGFALVHEAARRALGIDYYDVQMLAGLALARGAIAEMATGEGKTFVAAFPAFVHALAGRGVHVMTVNSYLAERDATLMSPLFQRLGMTTGLLRSGDAPDKKRSAYLCDVIYGPGYEFGFDYLRDQLALLNVPKPRLGESFRGLIENCETGNADPVQRDRAFAIVDEADSVMIDEATTPLVLSGSAAQPSRIPQVYLAARRMAASLVAQRDYIIDTSAKTVRLTDTGVQHAVANLDPVAMRGVDRPWPNYIEQALFATVFLQRDVDYVVSDGKVMLVDEFTGRIFADRTLREGLHQAVEAKEDLEVTAETQSLARISRQRFFSLYSGLCGMTGTTAGSEGELYEAYGLSVTRIATRLPCRRVVFPTRYFASAPAKWDAVADAVEQMHHTRRPVLVGTRTIEASELVARRLQSRGLTIQLLNGKQDEEEARIIALAGQAESITIATNMAGRGTDIKLGAGVAELGGLHVVGTERHESGRVDRQLAGRAARQGDPGSCQFFVSSEDSLIVRLGPWLGETMKQLAGQKNEIDLDVSRQVHRIQAHAERQAYARRQQLFKHDKWQEQVLCRLASEGPS